MLADDHDQLNQLLDKVLASEDVGQCLPRLDLFWARLAMHIRAEHLHLFPAVLKAAGENDGDGPSLAQVEEGISGLRHDHDFFMRELSGSIVSLRKLSASGEQRQDDELARILVKIEQLGNRLASHNQSEETGVYVWMENLLTPDDQLQLLKQLRIELAKMPPRFSDVKES